jgi:carboxyl-terminal processing protease
MGEEKKKSKAIKAAGFVIGAIALLWVGFQLGSVQNPQFTAEASVTEFKNVDFSLFWDAIGMLKNSYLKSSEIKDEDLFYGAIEGAVNSLGDPYTEFIRKDDAQKFSEDLNGNFGGIGAELGEKDGQIIIVAPMKNTPADKTGLKAGDQILKVDDTMLSGMSVEDTVKIIRGEAGTEVKLLIMREEWTSAKEFILKREVIQVPTLDYEVRDDKISVIKLHNFNANASSLFYGAALETLVKGSKGIILDLRNDPGGYLDVAIDIAGWFVKRGETVVQERFYNGKTQEFKAQGNSALEDIPIVVLVNGGSASASEILAGTLRDIRGAKIVGEKSFGKGTVQEIQSLKDGSMLKMTVAEWLTPRGSEINKKGITPDFEVKNDDKSKAEGKDLQMEKAIEVIKSYIHN